MLRSRRQRDGTAPEGRVLPVLLVNVRSLRTEQNGVRSGPVLKRSGAEAQKSRKKMCILAVVLSIVLTIVGIIIWQATK
ncbi:unnamed protein product [Coregonus sp. 'balchen']|nr:unnamed protein product [Coregonus sp. 'balchen']